MKVSRNNPIIIPLLYPKESQFDKGLHFLRKKQQNMEEKFSRKTYLQSQEMYN